MRSSIHFPWELKIIHIFPAGLLPQLNSILYKYMKIDIGITAADKDFLETAANRIDENPQYEVCYIIPSILVQPCHAVELATCNDTKMKL